MFMMFVKTCTLCIMCIFKDMFVAKLCLVGFRSFKGCLSNVFLVVKSAFLRLFTNLGGFEWLDLRRILGLSWISDQRCWVPASNL